MSEYDPTALAAAIARAAGVTSQHVTVRLSSASVLIEATVDVPAGSTVEAVTASLTTNLLGSQQAAAAFLGISLVAAPQLVAATSPRSLSSPPTSPPIVPPASPPLQASNAFAAFFGGGEEGQRLGLVVVSAGGAVCIALCLCFATLRILRRARQDAQPLVKVHDGRETGRHIPSVNMGRLGPSVTTSI